MINLNYGEKSKPNQAQHDCIIIGCEKKMLLLRSGLNDCPVFSVENIEKLPVLK